MFVDLFTLGQYFYAKINDLYDPARKAESRERVDGKTWDTLR